jgi:hypothetical protein
MNMRIISYSLLVLPTTEVFSGLHPFFSQFLKYLVKPLFIFGSKKILQPQLPCPLQIETFYHEGTGS